MISYLCCLVIFISSINAQVYTNLNTLKGEGAVNTLYNGVSSIYITKFAQDDSLLKQIFFTSDSGTISAYKLANRRLFIGSDMVLGYPVTGITTMTTNVTNDLMSVVKGGLYFTTEAQSRDKYFQVYDISQPQQVTLDAGDYTLVFLNGPTTNYPETATAIRNWTQTNDKTAYIYDGIPKDVKELADTQIFGNPIRDRARSLFFDSVEDFSITSSPFYMKISGDRNTYMTFNTNAEYLDINHSKTKKPTTTGFFMKSRSEKSRLVTITLSRDTTFTGITGVNSIASIPMGGSIYVQSYEGNLEYPTIFNSSLTTVNWNIPLVQNTLAFSSENVEGGQFYLQYYFIKGDPIPSTTPSGSQTPPITLDPNNKQSTKKVETSTKSSNPFNLIQVLHFIVFFYISISFLE